MTTGRVVRGLAGAALLIAVVTAVSRVVGFGRVLVFSKTVGDTCLGDVYNTANLLPNVAFELSTDLSAGRGGRHAGRTRLSAARRIRFPATGAPTVVNAPYHVD